MAWHKKWCKRERLLLWFLKDKEDIGYAEIHRNINKNFGRNRTLSAIKSQMGILRDHKKNSPEYFNHLLGIDGAYQKMNAEERKLYIGIEKNGRDYTIQK